VLGSARRIRGRVPVVLIDQSVRDLDRLVTIASDQRVLAGRDPIRWTSFASYSVLDMARAVDDMAAARSVRKKSAPAIGFNSTDAVRTLVGQGLVDVLLVGVDQIGLRVFRDVLANSPILVSDRCVDLLGGESSVDEVFSSTEPISQVDSALTEFHP